MPSLHSGHYNPGFTTSRRYHISSNKRPGIYLLSGLFNPVSIQGQRLYDAGVNINYTDKAKSRAGIMSINISGHHLLENSCFYKRRTTNNKYTVVVLKDNYFVPSSGCTALEFLDKRHKIPSQLPPSTFFSATCTSTAFG